MPNRSNGKWKNSGKKMPKPQNGRRSMERRVIFPFRIRQPENESNATCATPTGKTRPDQDKQPVLFHYFIGYFPYTRQKMSFVNTINLRKFEQYKSLKCHENKKNTYLSGRPVTFLQPFKQIGKRLKFEHKNIMFKPTSISFLRTNQKKCSNNEKKEGVSLTPEEKYRLGRGRQRQIKF